MSNFLQYNPISVVGLLETKIIVIRERVVAVPILQYSRSARY
jgi:hypothetical protein